MCLCNSASFFTFISVILCLYCFCCKCVSVFFFFFFLIILTSSEISLKAIRFKLLIEGAADLGDRKVFRRFLPVPTFVFHVGKINLT